MSPPEKIVVASANAGKLREIAELLQHLAIQVVPQSDFDVPAPEESGQTFVENALIKARHAAELSGLPAIADDSGIEVDALNGAPGIYSARYAGIGASDEDNLRLLLERLAGFDRLFDRLFDRPTARFQCLMVYMRRADDPVPLIAQGTWHGQVSREARGDNGFGYDPIFYVPTERCTAAELSAEVKNRLSHRGQALRQLLDKLSGSYEIGQS